MDGRAASRNSYACLSACYHAPAWWVALRPLAQENRVSVAPKPIHPFPARMAAAIPWGELSESSRTLRVLDPMAGSGTSLVVARKLGHSALGFDTDPLAILLARTWCADLPYDVGLVAISVLDRARRIASTMRLRDAYPSNADEETRQFLRYWFHPGNRRQLASLALAIGEVRGQLYRDVLSCAFSRLIITKQASASRALDLAHSRPHRVNDRKAIRPFEHFLSAVGVVTKAAPFQQPLRSVLPRADVRKGDARSLPLDDSTVDVVITSPPYVNAIDYLRAHKFTLVWLGHDVGTLRRVRSNNIGTEAAAGENSEHPAIAAALNRMGRVDRLAPRFRAMLAKYATDMHSVLGEIARVLVPNGRAIIVVGDCTMRGVFVSNSRAITSLAEYHGFVIHEPSRRRLPPNRRYLPPPSASSSGSRLQGRMRTEVILRLSKAA